MSYIDNISNFTVTGNIPSTSSTTGSLVLQGGIGIQNNTDSVSITNGGTFTTEGGVAVAKKLFAGSYNATLPAYISVNDASLSQSITTAVTTVIDVNGFSSISNTTYTSVAPTLNNGQFTVNEDGWYLLTGSFEWTPNVTGVRRVEVLQNVTIVRTFERWASNVLTTNTMPITILLKLTNADVISFQVTQTSGISLNVTSRGLFSLLKLF